MDHSIEQVIEEYKNIVYSIAHKLYVKNKVFSKEDLIQVGFLAICKSADKYDYKRGKRSTFFTHCAKNDMIKFIRANRFNPDLTYTESIKLSYSESQKILQSDTKDYFNLKTDVEEKIINLKRAGESNIDIGKKLNINPNKVTKILSKIRERLVDQHE